MNERIMIAGLWITLIPAVVMGQTAVLREQIADHLIEHVVISKRLGQSLDNKSIQELMVRVEQRIRQLSMDALPEQITVPSEADKKRIQPGILVDYDDNQLLDLLIREKYMNVKITAGVINDYAPPDAAETQAIRNNLSYLVRGMRNSMVRHLGEWIEPPRIDRVLEQFEQSLDSKINALDTYALKQRTSDNVLDDFLAEVERRLAVSAKRVPERLAVLTAAEEAEKVN